MRRSSSGSRRAGSSTMLKRYLPRLHEREQADDEDELHREQPHVREWAAERQADAERGELRREAEVRHLADVAGTPQDALEETVLPAVRECVGAREHRVRLGRRLRGA